MAPKKKPKTREEILEQKRLAERLRRERIKNDPQKREEMREKERQKYKIKKERGSRKLVKDMTDREHRTAVKKWRAHGATYRAKKKALKEVTNTYLRENTPDSDQISPDSPIIERPRSAGSKRVVARKRLAKNRRDRIMRQKNKQVDYYKKKMEKYKKKFQRLTKRNSKNSIDTPNTKLHKLCETPDTRKDVVKKALFGEVLNNQLKENYRKLRTNEEKQIFEKVVSGKLVDKYKLWRSEDSAISYKGSRKSAQRDSLIPSKRTRRDGLTLPRIKTVRKFYQQDEVSRLGAGKRECVTRKGVKKQKRYLLDTMLNLHKKFKEDNFNISYQTFCRLRPFWVSIPKVNDRDTCLCIKHANIDLKLSALHNRKILPYSGHNKLLEDTCCNRYNEQCLSRNCQRCVDKNPHYKEFDDSQIIEYKKWMATKQVYKDPKSNQPRSVTKYLKTSFVVRPRELIEELQNELEGYFEHERNIVHQYKAIKDLKTNLNEQEAIIHMDFSENYCAKYNREIQAYHFGGSRLQLSMHTVVVYTKDNIQSYCTVSENTTHSPASIWAHLQPIFESLLPQITCIHFVSDGPVTQYRNKTMFNILATKLHLAVPNIEKFTWNFSESGHGKGAPDGIGATCKRTADAVVAAGGDIDSLESFVEAIRKRCPRICIFTIEDEVIKKMSADIKNDETNLKSFSGTLKVHQVKGRVSKSPLGLSQGTTDLEMKSLSCNCSDKCQHFNLGVIHYKIKTKLTVDDIYTESESENEPICSLTHSNPISTCVGTNNMKTNPRDDSIEFQDVAGPSSTKSHYSCEQYKVGDHVLVKFPAKNIEYRYVGIVNQVDDEDAELTVMFMKIRDDKGQMFSIDENDVSGVAYENIIEKLPNPQIVLKGKRIFYTFPISIPVFEK